MKSTENTVSAQAQKTINLLNAIMPNVVGYVKLDNYTNKFGEVANHLFNVGVNYGKAKIKDVATLETMPVTNLATSVISSVLLEQARAALIAGFVKPSKARSAGQIDAYTHVGTGIKVHNVTGDIYIYGYRENKEIITKGVYPTVNSRALTLAKNILKKDLKTNKFVNFKIKGDEFIKSGGNMLKLS